MTSMTAKTYHYFIAEVADNCSLGVAFIGGKQGAVRTYNFAIFFVFVHSLVILGLQLDIPFTL